MAGRMEGNARVLERRRGRLEDWKDNAKYMRKRGRLGESEKCQNT